MKVKLVIGKFRSKDTATMAIERLGQNGFLQVSFHQIGKTPVSGVDTMSNAYAGELPLYARGVLGSDVAIEGTGDFYSKEDARKIMGGDTKPPNAYAVAVNITDSRLPSLAEEILAQTGADTETHEVDIDEE